MPLVERRGDEGSPPLVERRRSEGSPLRGIALDAGQKTRAPSRPETAIPDWLAEANAAGPLLADSPGDHGVRIHALPERLITGRVRVGADAQGPAIHHLAFSLDGRERIRKRRPPYQVEIDVGAAPRPHSLRVDARDEQGAVLATDEVTINSGPHRFAVRLTSPRRGAAHTRSVRAAAEVEAPRHERLDRVEFFLNDTRTATLYQPPFEQPIRIDPAEPLSYVRAVAYLETGAWAEDLVFVNSRNLVEEVEVALVELYTSVTDRSGAPVVGLAEADFEVFVDGERQLLQRFDNAANQPIHAGVLFDTSLSMIDRLDAAEEAALHFFELVLGPRDRAALITFNDRPDLAVGFTGSKEALAGGARRPGSRGRDRALRQHPLLPLLLRRPPREAGAHPAHRRRRLQQRVPLRRRAGVRPPVAGGDLQHRHRHRPGAKSCSAAACSSSAPRPAAAASSSAALPN